MQTKQALAAGLLLLGIIALTATVTGGDLNPGNTPSPTMRSLDELYKNIQPGLPSDWQAYPTESQVTGSSAIHLTLFANGTPIPGSVTAPLATDTIRIVGLGHQVEVPIDLATGLPTGSRRHGVLVLTKYVDKSSPLLYKALAQGEQISAADLKFYRTDELGRQEHYQTIHLEGGHIVKIQTAYPNIEQVSLMYQSIRWTWEPDGIEFQDDWLNRI